MGRFATGKENPLFMNPADIIRKAVAGEPLEESEKTLLAGLRFDPESTETELNRLKEELAGVTAERDDFRTRFEGMAFRGKIAEIADKHRFVDRDYLAYLARERQVAVDDSAETERFMEGLRGEYPRFFRVELTPGAGSPSGDAPPSSGFRRDSAGEIARMIADAPGVGNL